ncbi:MAG: pyridoxal phosphate-dependent aminotransferase, partial [Bdellovibrionaceae bacterium]|nr:pyridoxal phosphate-dependent aminotransferase [Pseudobdellovibrionaceae bacterium]
DSKYGPAQGLLSTRKVVSQWMNDLYQQQWQPENVVISPGSKYSLYSLLQILGDENTELLIPSPYWVSYVTLGKLANINIKIIECSSNENYKLSATKLKNLITGKNQLLLLNSPQNPTGAIYSKEELQSLAEVIKQSPQLTVICDDIYNQLIFSSEYRAPHVLDFMESSSASKEDIYNQVIVVHGASKSFALTGWRLGWTAASREISKKLSEFQSQTLTCMPDFLQIALEKTLQQETQFVLELKSLINRRYQIASQKLNSCPFIKVFPSAGAFYIWFEVLDKSKNSAQMASELLEQHGVAVVPGASFGCEYHLRFSVTIPDDQLLKGIERIIQYFTQKNL